MESSFSTRVDQTFGSMLGLDANHQASAESAAILSAVEEPESSTATPETWSASEPVISAEGFSRIDSEDLSESDDDAAADYRRFVRLERRGRRRRRDDLTAAPVPSELNMYQRHLHEVLADSALKSDNDKYLLRDLLDISPTLSEAASAIIDDSFTRCFKSNSPEPWNWNIYLFPLWVLGVIMRYGILFPIRLVLLAIGWIIFLGLFIPIHILIKKNTKLRQKLERGLVEFICSVFVASWTGVIKYHGPRPSRRAKQVYVANHTSMIDFIVLEQMTAFAVIMQKHPGWVGLLQTTVLESLGCIWFNRTEAKDRIIVAKKLKQHVEDPDSNPLLIFPEGTCVNNEYTVMFKKGAFELDCTVCPIAIKYNKIFVDAFWNSKQLYKKASCCFVVAILCLEQTVRVRRGKSHRIRPICRGLLECFPPWTNRWMLLDARRMDLQSFTKHLLRLMTSWAVVCDVWYLEPQTLRPGETSIEFAERVRDMIAERAGIKKVPWDGYLKYFRPSVKLTEKKQQKFAESVIRRLEESQPTDGSKVA